MDIMLWGFTLPLVKRAYTTINLCNLVYCMLLKPLFGRPGPPDLKCTSAAAPTLQQTVACGLGCFNACVESSICHGCSNRQVTRWLPVDTIDAVSSQPCSVIV